MVITTADRLAKQRATAADRTSKQQQQQQEPQQQQSSSHHHNGHPSAHARRPSCCVALEFGADCGEIAATTAARQRQDSQVWLSRWAHVWTKRQSPEWKPRRASVATCQLLHPQLHYQQQTSHYQQQQQQQQHQRKDSTNSLKATNIAAATTGGGGGNRLSSCDQIRKTKKANSAHCQLTLTGREVFPSAGWPFDQLNERQQHNHHLAAWKPGRPEGSGGNSVEVKSATATSDDDDDDDEDDDDELGDAGCEQEEAEKTRSDASSSVVLGSGEISRSGSSSSRSSAGSSDAGGLISGAGLERLQQHRRQQQQQQCCSNTSSSAATTSGSVCCCCFSSGQLAIAGRPTPARSAAAAALTSKIANEEDEEEEVNRSTSSSSSSSMLLCWCRRSESATAANGLVDLCLSRSALTAAESAVADGAANSVAPSSGGGGCFSSGLATNNSLSGAKNKLNNSTAAAAAAAAAAARATNEEHATTRPLRSHSCAAEDSNGKSKQQISQEQPATTTIGNNSNNQSLQIQQQQRKSLIRSMMRRMVSEDCLRIRGGGGQQSRNSSLVFLQNHQANNNNNNNNITTSNNNNNDNNSDKCSLKRRETTSGLSGTRQAQQISETNKTSQHDNFSGNPPSIETQREAPNEASTLSGRAVAATNANTTSGGSSRQRRCGETDLKHLVNEISTCLARSSPESSSSSAPLSPDGHEHRLEAAAAAEEAGSSEERLEAAIVESWLDDHPRFVRDYFIRKANHQLINDWLLTNAKLNNLTAAPTQLVVNGFSSSAQSDAEQQLKPQRGHQQRTPMTSGNGDHVHAPNERSPATTTTNNIRGQTQGNHLSSSSAAAATLSTSPSQQQLRILEEYHRGREDSQPNHTRTRINQSADSEHLHEARKLRAHRSNSQSGSASHLSSPIPMPVRKISATDFETRTGSGYLRPMVSRTPDGRPTFLSQLDVSQSLMGRDGDLFNKEKYISEIEKERKRKKRNNNNSDEMIEQQETTIGGRQDQLLVGIEHDEIGLIFELVKNICNDLDIQTLLHKILKNIAVLINADKSSLFLVSGGDGGERHLVSQLFNVDQESDETDMERMNSKGPVIKIPWGTGLVGYVAASGESINIANCYEDPRFTDTIDQQTGYVTKNMLCAPILDKRNDIVGVAQVINKRDGNQFSKADELKFVRYLQFCGIGLRNAQSYENCQLENKRNQVILDLARIIFEEQSTIEQVVHKIILHTQSLLECERCQVLLIDDGSEDLEQLLQLPAAVAAPGGGGSPTAATGQQIGGSDARTVGSGCGSAGGGAASDDQKPKWRPHCRNLDSGAGSCNSSSSCCESDAVSSIGSSEPMASTKREGESKLFSLVFDLECSGRSVGGENLVMHNRQTESKSKPKLAAAGESARRKFPINIGITSYVAMTGETLNIEDAHKCPRFDPSVDENSNFRHKSILCMPIRNGKRQIIGVSQLINKKNGRPFNKNDEDLFEAFSIFCGLGIHNTLMYEKVLKIMAKQRVTFEVLSYHATAPLEEAKKLHAQQIPSSYALNLTSLAFNDFSLDEQFMLKSCLRFFLDLDLMRRFQIDQLVFCNWILSVQKNYRTVTYHPIVGGNGLKAAPVGYHNWRHAFNVSQMMFAILINTQICRALGELETLALLIACLCHDLDHRGTNNSFQIKSASPLAELYSTSTMEHHHFDQCVMILNSQGNQILANLSPEEYSRVICLLEEAILATDLANYFQKREHFFQLVDNNQFDWRSNEKHRSLLRCMLMTACDVAAITKPWSIQKVVADLVMSEFHQQGDIEKHELHIEPIDLMNRDKMSKLPEMQIGFIDSICAPIYTAFAKLFPLELKPLLDGCIANRELWHELARSNKKSTDTPL